MQSASSVETSPRAFKRGFEPRMPWRKNLRIAHKKEAPQGPVGPRGASPSSRPSCHAGLNLRLPHVRKPVQFPRLKVGPVGSFCLCFTESTVLLAVSRRQRVARTGDNLMFGRSTSHLMGRGKKSERRPGQLARHSRRPAACACSLAEDQRDFFAALRRARTSFRSQSCVPAHFTQRRSGVTRISSTCA